METWQKVLIVVGVMVLVLIGLVAFFVTTQNDLVNKDNTCAQMWGNVQTAYQRRADLIPNLVATVQGAATFEMKTQTEIADLRSQAGSVKAQVYNAQTVDQMQAADTSTANILSRLMLIVEAYPDLKSNKNFEDLQGELEGTENRIKYERDNYNAAVKDYRNEVQMIPTSFVASYFHYDVDKWKTFEATEQAQTAPTVSFNFNLNPTAAATTGST
ncbi:MAG TPA: LemA family protein [Methanomicrobiales archaeon]|nr:LemA family protein [Methanomicrobiales archaeon]